MSKEAFSEVGSCISTRWSLCYVSTLYGEKKKKD